MNYIELNERGFADDDGYVKCHICNSKTREYIGVETEFISKHTGLPAWAFLDAPPNEAPSGYVWTRQVNSNSWDMVEDHRGKTVYDTMTKKACEITELGQIPDGKTVLQPNSPFDKWTGDAWERDDEAEQSAKLEAAQIDQATRLANANQQIAIIKPAVDGGYAKPGHPQLLADWQRCRYELTLVPEQPGWPEKPQWPTEPEKVI